MLTFLKTVDGITIKYVNTVLVRKCIARSWSNNQNKECLFLIYLHLVILWMQPLPDQHLKNTHFFLDPKILNYLNDFFLFVFVSFFFPFSMDEIHRNLHRDLHSYLLGEQEDNDANQPVNNNNNNPPPGHHNNNNNPAPAVGEGLHAAHQAILQQGGPVGFQPYHRPLRFPFRVRKTEHPARHGGKEEDTT